VDEESKKRRWPAILFCISLAALLFGFIYAAIMGPRSYQRYRQLRESADRATTVSAPLDNKHIRLDLGVKRPVDGIRLVYRGVEGEKVKIGVIIPDLDPEYEYLHIVPINEAREGMRLGGQAFKLTADGKTALHLERFPAGFPESR
jgi:hypothetical protein